MKRRFPLSRGLILLIIVLLLAAWGGAAFVLLRPRPVWYLDEEYAALWLGILDSAEPPFSLVEPYPGDGKIPKNRYGYIITSRLKDGGPSDDTIPVHNPADTIPANNNPAFESPLRMYPGLSRTGEYQGALVLALNPWMVFSRHQDSVLTRSRVDARSGAEGYLILPGGEPPAVWAWLTQLFQNPPGIFPESGEAWDPAWLFRGRRFQQGAATYTWEDAWTLFFKSRESWIYAPLQMVRELPPYQMGLLRAARFPERDDWTEFGLQAEILWAIPFMGKEKFAAPLAKISSWLKNARTQTIIANRLNWIPAHSGGTPFNPVSREAQLAWISSSFIWQPEPEVPGN